MSFEYEEKTLRSKTELLKAIAHPTRLCILQGLQKNGPCCPSEMQECLKMPQSTVSQHLARLRQIGIIEGTRQGVEIHYKLVNPEVKAILEILLPNKGAEYYNHD